MAHALLRAVFALLRTRFSTQPKRSHECERGTQECVRYTVFKTFGGPAGTSELANAQLTSKTTPKTSALT